VYPRRRDATSLFKQTVSDHRLRARDRPGKCGEQFMKRKERILGHFSHRSGASRSLSPFAVPSEAKCKE